MRKLFLVFLLFTPLQQISAQTTWKVAYETPFGTQEPLTSIPMSELTHIIHIGGAPLANGSVVLSPNFAAKSTQLISLAHAAGVKVIFSLADTDSFQSGDFGDAVTNHLALFVTNIMSVVSLYGYDGVDIDWEKGDYTFTLAGNLLSALRTALGSNILTSAVLAQGPYWNDYCSTHNLGQYLDRIDALVYDEASGWTVEWFNSPLFRGGGDVPYSVNYMLQTGFVGDGCLAAKINMGLPFYGYTITGGNVTNTPRAVKGGTPPTFAEQDYSTIVANFNITSPNYDTLTHAYWISVSGGWLTFDNPASIFEKVQYVTANSFGGWFAYNLNTDFIGGAHVLLNAANGIGVGGTTLTPGAVIRQGVTVK